MKKPAVEEKLRLLCDKYGFVKEYLRVLGVPSLYAEDILQETFLAAYTHLGQLKEPGSMEPWLCRIAFRNVLRYRKKRKIALENEERIISYDYDTRLTVKSADEEFVISSLDYRITSGELYDMIKKLGLPASRIIPLRFEMGFKLSEIAKGLGMNYNTVKTIERRAIKKLKLMIEERCRKSRE